jgi:hypothetical protein
MEFRKKPVVIEAIQYTGANLDEVLQFAEDDSWEYEYEFNKIVIATLEGEMIASVGDWIIKGVNGEFYPCKPDIFEKTYEEA